MGSDAKKPPRPRHRFIFPDRNKPPAQAPNAPVLPHEAGVTRDDILNSLTRQAHPGEEPFAEENIQQISSNRERGPSYGPLQDDSFISGRSHTGKNRGSLFGALTIFLGGLFAVWLYGYVSRAYEIPYLSGITQSPEVQIGAQVVSAYPIPFGVASVGVLVIALYAVRRRKA